MTTLSKRPFKAFRSKIDVVVCYEFNHNMLKSIVFIVSDSTNKNILDSRIANELTDIYGLPARTNYNNGSFSRLWFNKGMLAFMLYNKYENSIVINFRPSEI